jgi:outer membrane protein assembly factor BamD (BamD/ComL family)
MNKPHSHLKQSAFAFMFILALSLPIIAQEEGGGRKKALNVDLRAKQHFDKAVELMEYKEYERGIAMLETVIRDNQGNILGYRSHMVIGKHLLSQNKTNDAQSHFKLLTRLLAPKPSETGAKRDEEIENLYRESLFQSGYCSYKAAKYTAAFPMFRRLTEVAAKTDWANKAYFYIGMSHYNLKSWNKAIDALSLVGTEMEDSGDEMGRIEIGQRFYAKISDEDIPVLQRLKKRVIVKVICSNGDVEELTGVPVAGKKNELLASAPTVVGKPIAGDRVIQMYGGDTLKVIYSDETTLDGKKDVERSGEVKAVSTGVIGFYKGDYSTPSPIAYPGDPQHIMLKDADLDISDKAENITVTIISKYKEMPKENEQSEDEDAMDIFIDTEEKKAVWKERDSIQVTLVEVGKPGEAIRGGTFKAKFKLGKLEDGITAGDDVLTCNELDELEVRYTDGVHIYGEEARESVVTIPVSGSINSGVQVAVYKVNDLILKVKKNQVEADASIGLGKIYDDMGLEKRAEENAAVALKKVDTNLTNKSKIAESKLIEESFRAKWEAEFLKKDFSAATKTCQAFNNLYPESVLADQALMTLSRTLFERGDYQEAVASYKSVLSLKNPISAAEAQYRIGEVLEKAANESTKDATNSNWTTEGQAQTALQQQMGQAIAAYRATFERYPESPFAAQALGKVVRHYVESNDFSQASDLLERVFSDFPDAPFLDEMLMLWAQVAMRMNDNEMAVQKLRQLTFDYPSSKFNADAKKKLAGLEKLIEDKEDE